MTPETPDYTTRTFQFACQIVDLFRVLMRTRTFPFHIARQILKAGTSIGANLEEAKASQSRKELASKFSIALKEARETKYWLRLIVATGLAERALIAKPLRESDELVAILTVSYRKLKVKKGNKLPRQ